MQICIISFYIILFIYFWLCWVFIALNVFSSCGEQELLSSCSAWASHCGGFSCCRAQALGAQAPAVVAHGLSRRNSRALRAQAQKSWCTGLVACGIFPNQRWNLCLRHWQANFLLLEPLGKSIVGVHK